MYSKSFYITENLWNNAFSFQDRKNPRLYVPALKQIWSYEEIKLLSKNNDTITFEEYDFNDVMQSCYWLENLYWNTVEREKDNTSR